MKVFSPAPMSIALSSAGPGYGYPLVPVDCSPGLLVDPYYPVVILDPGEKNTSYYHYGLGCLYHVSHEPGLEPVIQRGLLPGLCPGNLYPCASAFTTGGATSLQVLVFGFQLIRTVLFYLGSQRLRTQVQCRRRLLRGQP